MESMWKGLVPFLILALLSTLSLNVSNLEDRLEERQYSTTKIEKSEEDKSEVKAGSGEVNPENEGEVGINPIGFIYPDGSIKGVIDINKGTITINKVIFNIPEDAINDILSNKSTEE